MYWATTRGGDTDLSEIVWLMPLIRAGNRTVAISVHTSLSGYPANEIVTAGSVFGGDWGRVRSAFAANFLLVMGLYP
jgi:hypothetical protein